MCFSKQVLPYTYAIYFFLLNVVISLSTMLYFNDQGQHFSLVAVFLDADSIVNSIHSGHSLKIWERKKGPRDLDSLRTPPFINRVTLTQEHLPSLRFISQSM